MDRVAVFVDAGYLFAQGSVALAGRKLPRGRLLLDHEKAIDALAAFATRVSGVDLLRVYWYDGTSTGPNSQHITLAHLAHVKVRLGFVNSVGEQKGVDSLIVTDMIALARNHAMSEAVLLSGDEDLRVGVQQAQEFGVRVHLLGIRPSRGSQSLFLLQEADSTHEWSPDDLAPFLSCKPEIAVVPAMVPAVAAPAPPEPAVVAPPAPSEPQALATPLPLEPLLVPDPLVDVASALARRRRSPCWRVQVTGFSLRSRVSLGTVPPIGQEGQRSMRELVALVLVTIVLSAAATSAQSSKSPTANDETITIDGSKHPELIPESSAWGYAFRAIVRGVDLASGRGAREDEGLPTIILRAIPEDQHAALIKRLRDGVANQASCNDRGLKEREQLTAEKNPQIWAKLNDIVMECRRGILQSRDDLLASLPPSGQVAFRQFVDGTKRGMTITLKRSELGTYRLPE